MKSNLSDLSPFEECVIKCISESKFQEGQCARNSIIHLEKARKIADIDPEMAYFRAITAEEEAASAIIYSLKRLGYKNSKRLKPHDHKQKNSIYPFLLAVNHYFKKFSPLPYPVNFVVNRNETTTKMYLQIQLPGNKQVRPIPPLNFSITDLGLGEKALFNNEFEEMATRIGEKDLTELIGRLANQKNFILYASENGIAKIGSDIDKGITAIKDHVFILLEAFCLIFPYEEKSIFVQQLINGFLISLGSITKENISW